jgi:hypothetical protein
VLSNLNIKSLINLLDWKVVKSLFIIFIIFLVSFSAYGEALHLKVEPLPKMYDTNSTYSTIRYSLKYKHQISIHRNLIQLRTYVYATHKMTIYKNGRSLMNTSSETEPAQISFIFSQYFYPQSVILYKGAETPIMSLNNASYDGGDDIFYKEYTWNIMLPQKLSEKQISKVTVQDNQVNGSIIISFPDFKNQTQHTLEKSEYNIQRLFPYCKIDWEYNYSIVDNRFLINCLANSFNDFRKLDPISRKERISNSKMTPLQKKVFKRSKEYKSLLAKMKQQKKELKDLLFCLPLATGEYLLNYKGLEVSSTLTPKRYEKSLSIRFSNLGKRKSKNSTRRYLSSPEKTFLKMNEKVGLVLENQQMIACFKPSSKLKFRKAKAKYIILSGFFKGKREADDYHFLEATLYLLYLKDKVYSVDQKGKVRKI